MDSVAYSTQLASMSCSPFRTRFSSPFHLLDQRSGPCPSPGPDSPTEDPEDISIPTELAGEVGWVWESEV